MRKKVKAFTIVDLIIALLISSVIISIAYYVLSLFNNHFITYQRSTTAVNDFYFFDQTWVRDWEKARYIIDKGDKELEMQYSDETKVYYSIKGEALIRIKNNAVDTLPVTVAAFKKQPYDTGLDLIQQLDMTVSVQGETINCSYTKYYAVKELLQK